LAIAGLFIKTRQSGKEDWTDIANRKLNPGASALKGRQRDFL